MLIESQSHLRSFSLNCNLSLMAPKNIMVKMQWELIGNFLILWFWCLVASAAAKCHPESCGSMNVSYPFWIENPSCGYDGFQIKCMANVNNYEYTLFLPTPSGDFEILNRSYSGHIIINSTSLKAMSCNGRDDAFKVFSLPKEGPFAISSKNKFAVIGCGSMGSFTDNIVVGRCEAPCSNVSDTRYCNSYGCCTSVIPRAGKFINFTGGGIKYPDMGVCGFSTILQPRTFRIQENEKGLFGRGRYGLRLLWGVGHENCATARGTSNYLCGEETSCKNSPTGKGHICTCHDGYQGDGYSNGTDCTDVNECSLENKCVDPKKGGICYNLPGSYTCSCRKGYIGNGILNGTGCEPISSTDIVIHAIIGSVSSVVGLSSTACALFWWLRRRHMKNLYAKYFQQNGGIHLQQYIASRGGRSTFKIYSAIELEKASKNYSTGMKLGSGGYGTVFKAILPEGIIGAIKKSKEIPNPQQEGGHQFINELIILSQINHRNVVKLLGCCLETQYPLLVCEFVPNGTLRQHIHSKEHYLSWEIRLRIAIETAEALAYLHSGASQPIFHRDVKSSNILLDNTYTPKVADFGISRLLNSDDTHLSTNIAGTMGYMDPEYFRSSQLTDRSDVYSFGVVLLELLTGLEPLSLERPTDENALSGLFLSRLNSNRLHEILDVSIMNEDNRMQMKNMASLARECLHEEGRRRPPMKEVVEELIWIRGATRRRKLYPRDEIYEINEGNQRGMQIGTSHTTGPEMEKLVLGSSIALMSFSIGGR